VIAALIGGGAALMSHGAGVGSGPAYAFFLVPLLVLLYIGILVYSVLIMLRFAVAYPACIEEDLTAWKALQRSASLTSGAKGRIFLVLLVVYAVVYALEIVCILVLVALAAVVAFVAMGAHVTVGSLAFVILVGLGVFAYALVIGVCILLSYAAFTTALAVLYHDQRLRKDILVPAPPLE
jgi:membrane-anchored glycerophosphoryl diester phosphodiesterase (GDPDase)